MLNCLTKKILFKPFTKTLTTNYIERTMATERELEVISNLTKIRQEIEQLRGNNNVIFLI